MEKKENHMHSNKMHMYIYRGLYSQKAHTCMYTCTTQNKSTMETSLHALLLSLMVWSVFETISG